MTIDQHIQLETDSDAQALDARITFHTLSELLHRMITPFYFLQAVPLPLVVIAIMWSQIDHRLLVGWGLLVMLSIYLRYRLAASFFKQQVAISEAEQWGRRFTRVSLFSASLWALAALLFFVPGSVGHQVFICVFVVSISIGAIIAGIYWLPSFYVFAIPVISALTFRLLIENTLAYDLLGLFLLWMFLNVAGMARALHKTVRSEMKLRHESALLNETLKEKTREAQQATKAKSRFLAAASHDLRQPLHSLSLFVDVLKDAKTDQERDVLFPRIDGSLDALRKLFDALLDISRLDAQVVQPEYSHFNLAELLNKLVEEFRPAAIKKGLQLRLRAAPLVVVSDCLLLERVLRNLVSNAIRYTSSGGVLLSCRQRGDQVLLQVWDTGMGIPQDSLEEVFVEFHQLHNSHRDRAEGLGLGLALVKRQCRLLNHPLALASEQDKGSVFSIRIVRGSEHLLASEHSAPRPHSWDLSGRRVLVIDDERDILLAMSALLSKWGCQVVTAHSLADAVSKLTEQDVVPEMVLSDLRLRNGETGIAAIDSLRDQFGADIAGVLISGDTDPQRIHVASQSNYELLQKPVKPLHLRTMIQHHLSVAED